MFFFLLFMAIVIQSESVERFSVSPMQDFFIFNSLLLYYCSWVRMHKKFVTLSPSKIYFFGWLTFAYLIVHCSIQLNCNSLPNFKPLHCTNTMHLLVLSRIMNLLVVRQDPGNTKYGMQLTPENSAYGRHCISWIVRKTTNKSGRRKKVKNQVLYVTYHMLPPTNGHSHRPYPC